MKLPPTVLNLNLARPGRRRVHLWLPLFLLWPLAAVVWVVVLAVSLVVDAVSLAAGRRHTRAVLVVRTLALMSETRGLVIHIDNARTDFDLTVR